MSSATIDLDNILTPEQRQALAKQVWEENEETIKNNIRKALHHELQSDVVHRAKKLLADELVAMTKVVIKEKLIGIEKTLNEVVGHLLGFEDEAVIDSISETTKDFLDEISKSAAGRFGEALRRGVSKALESGQQRYFTMRAARQRAGG